MSSSFFFFFFGRDSSTLRGILRSCELTNFEGNNMCCCITLVSHCSMSGEENQGDATAVEIE